MGEQMSHRVFRYQLPIYDAVKVEMPVGAKVLSVGPSRDGLSLIDLWALEDIEAPTETRKFLIAATVTGNELLPFIAARGRFIGTVPTNNGQFIWHVFERDSEES
jgi:hypothetical protein